MVTSPLALFSQGAKEAEEVLDVLNTTTTPAFVVMGVSNTEIARPTSLKDFTASLQSSTGGFTELPNTYGLEFLPLGGDSIALDSGRFSIKNISFSFGFLRENIGEPDASTRTGIGLNLPIFRPKKVIAKKEVDARLADFSSLLLTKESTEFELNRIKARIEEIGVMNKRMAPGQTIMELSETDRDVLVQYTQARSKLQTEALMLEAVSKLIRKERGSTKVRRQGLFLNLYGGMTWEYPVAFVADSSLTKWGGWITGGCERSFFSKKDTMEATGGFVSLVGVFRYFIEPHMPYIDSLGEVAIQKSKALDVGAKLAVSLFDGNFDLSFEGTWRKRPEKNVELKKTSKLLFNASYAFKKDFKVSLTFGKDFENNVTQDGNLVSLVNLIKGI